MSILRILSTLNLVAAQNAVIIDQNTRILGLLAEEQEEMAKEWDDVATAFTTLNANIDAENSKLADLGTQLSAAVAANDPTKIEGVATQILASAGRLTGAIAPAATAVAAVATAAASPTPTPAVDPTAAPAAAAATKVAATAATS